MTPAAITKAQSLARFALASGSPLNTFALVLTLGEAYELLDYIAAGGLGRCEHHAQLLVDIAQAKVDGNPFTVLAHFQLQGLDMVRADLLH